MRGVSLPGIAAVIGHSRRLKSCEGSPATVRTIHVRTARPRDAEPAAHPLDVGRHEAQRQLSRPPLVLCLLQRHLQRAGG